MVVPDGPASPSPLEAPVYALGSSPAERDRLRRQSEELRAHSAALLDRVGVVRGWNAVDLGCGPSGIIDLLAERVGPEGHVTGLDVNPANVALAREFADEHGLANADLAEGDARRTGLRRPRSTSRTPAPCWSPFPTRLRWSPRWCGWSGWGPGRGPGPDGGGSVCYPPHPAWDQLSLTNWSSWQSDGADLFIGRRLPELFGRPAWWTSASRPRQRSIQPVIPAAPWALTSYGACGPTSWSEG